MAPSSVGRYLVEERFGETGVASLYRGHDEATGRSVTVLVLPRMPDQAARRRFLNTVRMISGVVHRNLATIYEAGELDEQLYVVMEDLHGRTLNQVVQGLPLPTELITKLGAQIADALGAAHEAGIVHRDLRPENIVIDERGGVKVLDIGTTSLQDFEDTPSLWVGDSPAYATPEKIKGQESNPSSDIFALGALLYQMSTGTALYSERNFASTSELYRAILNEKPKPIHEKNPAIPAALEAIILESLEKRPENRIPSMRDFARALRAIDPASPPERVDLRTARSHATIRPAFAKSVAASILGFMLSVVVLGLLRFGGTPLGFALVFGALVISYESFLLLQKARGQTGKRDEVGKVRQAI